MAVTMMNNVLGVYNAI